MFESVNNLRAALADVGDVLWSSGEVARVAVVGGAALLLLDDGAGRATRDVDVAAVLGADFYPVDDEELPAALVSAVADVASVRGLRAGWFNDAVVASFGVRLPPGAIERGAVHEFGGLTVVAVAREDLISLKFLAAIERRPSIAERHVLDLISLKPHVDEIQRAAQWASEQQTDPAAFAERIGDLVRRLVPA